jgi:hypothetical protein
MVSPTQPQPVQALPDPIRYRHPRGAHKRRVVPADGIIPSDEQAQSGTRRVAKRPHEEMSSDAQVPAAPMSLASVEGTALQAEDSQRLDIDLTSDSQSPPKKANKLSGGKKKKKSCGYGKKKKKKWLPEYGLSRNKRNDSIVRKCYCQKCFSGFESEIGIKKHISECQWVRDGNGKYRNICPNTCPHCLCTFRRGDTMRKHQQKRDANVETGVWTEKWGHCPPAAKDSLADAKYLEDRKTWLDEQKANGAEGGEIWDTVSKPKSSRALSERQKALAASQTGQTVESDEQEVSEAGSEPSGDAEAAASGYFA